MSESYMAGAYWGRRLESTQACAQRAEVFFRLLSECHPSYAHWYEQHDSIRKALQLRIEPGPETFVRLFGKKKYQNGKDGYSLGAWTGHVDATQGGMVLLSCGGDAGVAPNSVRLDLPSEPLGSERMLTLAVIRGVMRAFAEAWEPDWAIATADGLWEELSQRGRLGGFVGWMTYLSRHRGEVPPLPAPVHIEPVNGHGTLVVLTPERLSPSNPEHVSLARHVQRALDEAGLLKPVVERRPAST